MKKLVALSATLLAGSVLFQFCKKEYDNPPLKNVNDGAQVNVAQLKARVPSTSSAYKFGAGDTNLYCTVIADESSNNIYKQVFVKDNFDGAIQVNLVYSGGLAVGDKIRINLNGLYLVNANNMIYIDSIDVGKHVVKLSSGNTVTPKVVTLAQIQAGAVPSNSNSMQSQLVQINSAEFTEKGKSIGDPIGKSTVERVLKQCNTTNTLLVRTSGYANFASKLTPEGNGTIIGVVTQYKDEMQFIIRNYDEVQMNGVCVVPQPTLTIGTPVNSINETFSSQTSTNNPVNLTGWNNYDELGTRTWLADVNAGNYRAKATSFGTSNPDLENRIWLITPPINASASPTLSFKSAMAYAVTGHPNPFTIWISKNFDGTNLLSAGTWTQVTEPTIAPLNGTNFSWVNSGTVNLTTYLQAGYTGTYFIAFRYYGNKPSGYTTNYYVDDIMIQ